MDGWLKRGNEKRERGVEEREREREKEREREREREDLRHATISQTSNSQPHEPSNPLKIVNSISFSHSDSPGLT